MAGKNEMADAVKRLPGELKKVIKNLPVTAKVKGLEFIDDNFANQGFTDKSNKPWKKRKKRPGRKARLQDEGRAILVKSGALRRGWNNDTKIVGMAVHFSNTQVQTEIHNEGGIIKHSAGHNIPMPQRQMIGESDQLDKMIWDSTQKQLTKIFSKK